MSAGGPKIAQLDILESAADLPTEAGITRIRRVAGVLQAGALGVPFAALGGACDFNSAAPAALRVVRLCSSSNIASLSGATTIDSVATVDQDRVLLTAQTTANQNGIYVVNHSGAWTRAADWNDGTQMSFGSTIIVAEGSAWKYSTWILVNQGAVIIGSTSLLFKPNGVDLDPVAALNTCSQANIGVASVSVLDAGNGSWNAVFQSVANIGLLQGITAGMLLGGIGYRGLADTTGWLALRGAQGKMTGAPGSLTVGGNGALAVTPDLTNFKLYGYDGQTNGSWKCYGEAYTALKRGTDLIDANQTIQPFTDKASRYDLPSATLTASRTKTLGTTSVVTGTKVTITRRDRTANTMPIANGGGGGGTLFTFAASPTETQRATFRFDGTNWALVDFEYIED